MLVVSLLATVLSFYGDFSALTTITVQYNLCYVAIVLAPFSLVILGFRVTSHTALVSMVAGALSILAWQKWIFFYTSDK